MPPGPPGMRNRIPTPSLEVTPSRPPSLYSGPHQSTIGTRRTTPEVYRDHGSNRSSETGSLPSQGLIHRPDRNEIRIFYDQNSRYSYMHEDAFRSLQRGVHESAALNNLRTENL